jgi:hypothetical protein
VDYVPYETARKSGLIGRSADSFTIGVDHTNVYEPGTAGRPSVRLESKQTFTKGLFVLDLSHIPTGCGTWPSMLHVIQSGNQLTSCLRFLDSWARRLARGW